MTQIVQAECPGCKGLLRIPADWLQRPLRCKHCRMIVQVRTSALPAKLPVVVPELPAPVVLAPAPGGAAPLRPIRQPAYELLFALLAILILTAGYVFLAPWGVPQPSSWLGHSLGIAGFLLMLSTETLYSLRKHLRGFHLGRMRTWLQIHIFTGIVGPYLVLLHSAGKFNGLAGVLTLLTVVLVVSGFVGRYIYTAVPRTLDGASVAVQELEERIAHADWQLQPLLADPLWAATLAEARAAPPRGWALVLGRSWLCWRQRQRLRRALEGLDSAGRALAAPLVPLLVERYRLQLQIQSLAGTRRLLALWHVVHLPLGFVLFTLALIHIGAALYFTPRS